MDKYENYMMRCIELAKRGAGCVSPNPMVGCVVLDKDENVISEGFHHKYGENHAERDALLKIDNGAEYGGVLIVNLEPCSHYGHTPPCVDLIIERGIKKVVVGCRDNNPKVNGKGIEKLKSAGIEVVAGVLENECRRLNEVFFKNVESNEIFVALKTATTADGKISTASGESKWITSEKSRDYAKNLRLYYDAILTSSSTVLADNPQMKHKLKIVLDRNFSTDFSYEIYKSGNIILVTSEENKNRLNNLPQNIKVISCKTFDCGFDLKELMTKLYDLNIKSVFVEAGGKLLGSFVKEDLADKIYHFIAPKIMNDSEAKSCFSGDRIDTVSMVKQFVLDDVKKSGSDALLIYRNKNCV